MPIFLWLPFSLILPGSAVLNMIYLIFLWASNKVFKNNLKSPYESFKMISFHFFFLLNSHILSQLICLKLSSSMVDILRFPYPSKILTLYPYLYLSLLNYILILWSLLLSSTKNHMHDIADSKTTSSGKSFVIFRSVSSIPMRYFANLS